MNKLNVNDLKKILKSNNLPTSGTKEILLKRYTELNDKKNMILSVEKSKHTTSWVSSDDKDFMRFIKTEFKDYELDPIDLTVDPCKKSLDNVRAIFEHQEFLKEYAKAHNEVGNELANSRGLFLYHTLGSGKTSSAILMAENQRIYTDETTGAIKLRKVIVIIPASLRDSPWVEEVSIMYPENKTQSSLVNVGYNFIHYNNTTTFMENLTRLQEEDSHNPFDNAVVIIDEVHNILNTLSTNKETVKWSIYNYLMTSKNTKIILLSATPIVNSPFEITFALNILKGKEIFNVIDNTAKEKFLTTFFNGDQMINKTLFKKYTQGLISHYKGASENAFAKKVIHNEYVPMSSKQWDTNNKIFNIENEKLEKSYKIGETRTDVESQIKTLKRGKALKVRGELAKILVVRSENPDTVDEQGQFYIYTRENSNFNYPAQLVKELNASINAGNILDQTKINTVLPHLDLVNKLSEYSPKMEKIIENINKSKGPVIVFSNFEGYYGIKIFIECLKARGYGNYFKDKKQDNYVIWSGNTSQEERVKILKVYNSDENMHGDLIKVICLTTAGKEGISLRSVRQIHIMEPWWNMNQTFQVIGRGIRICSHSHLPKEEQVVDVFNYISVKPSEFSSSFSEVEKNIMKRSLEKYKKGNEILELLKECSIDCDLNKEHNNIKNCIDFSYLKKNLITNDNIYNESLIFTDKLIKEITYKGKKYFIQFNKIYEYKEQNPKYLGIAKFDIDGNITTINFSAKDYEIQSINGIKYLSYKDELYQYLTDEDLEMGLIPIKLQGKL